VLDDAGTFPDKIIAANENLALAYFEGTIPTGSALADSFGKLPSLGYNLYAISGCDSTVDAGDAGPCIPSQWLDMSAEYDLNILSEPQISQIICDLTFQDRGPVSGGGSFWNVAQMGTPPGGYPQPGAAGLTCMGSTEYSVVQCQTTHTGLCDVVTNCSGMTVSLGGASAPSGWPCP
jgi:hypothetical protein